MMRKIYSKASNSYVDIDRIIGKIHGNPNGPTILFIAGIHGNEPAGVFALQQTLDELSRKKIAIIGTIYALSGNLSALEKGVRYQQQDLNRIWNKARINAIENNLMEDPDEETREQISLYQTLKSIITKERGPFYFMDLHTTSSETIPFLTVNDSMLNRNFTQQYPIPIILGIEEYLNGPLLSFINELGYIAFGFEGGQHDAFSSIENHVSFIYLSLVYAGIITKSESDYSHHYELLAKYSIDKDHFYEIDSRLEIKPGEHFLMKPGFVNFQRIKRGKPLATLNGQVISAKKNSRILMPQYQQQGDDGFFTIRKISTIFLTLSAIVRKLKADFLLTLLPGIKWVSKKKGAILVDKSIARFYTKQIFHLFGYRSRELDGNLLIMKNRELPARTNEYKF